MNLNQNTLVLFELERRKYGYIPAIGSNSFYTIANGIINLLTKDNQHFVLYTDSGHVYTGAGTFAVSSDLYEALYIITDTFFSVTDTLEISNAIMEVHGSLELMSHSKLEVKNNSNVIFYSDSVFNIKDDSSILVEPGSSITIYGRVDIHLNRMSSLLNVKGIIIDSAAVINVEGLELLGERLYSLTDYDSDLRKSTMNVYTQGETNTEYGRIGFIWTGGSPNNNSQLYTMTTLYGESILGDFKLSVLGFPETDIDNLQIITDINIRKNTTLYITEEYKGDRYVRPELYLGIIIGNNKIPANCDVSGTIIVDGKNSSITLDRESTIHIYEGGKIQLTNHSELRCTYCNDKAVLLIDGILEVDSMDQLIGFKEQNIQFGEEGKIVIQNKNYDGHVLLFTVPNGVHKTYLYELFKDRMDHVEYHIQENTGIGIDQYYEFYGREMRDWFGGRRFEQAIKDGILVWHDNAFIELYDEIIPWVNDKCSLLQASRLFKSYGSYDKDRLQEVVNHLKYAGCGDILFRFYHVNDNHEVTLHLQGTTMKSVYNQPMTNSYVLTTDSDGQLFIANKLDKATVDMIVTDDATSYDITNHQVEFPL